MKTRIISGAIFAVLMVAIVWLGGPVLAVAMFGISLLAYFELTKALKVHTEGRAVNAFEVVSIAFILAYYVLVFFEVNTIYIILLFALLLIVHMLIYVFSFPKYEATTVINSLFSFIYGPFMLSFILLTRMISNELDTENYNLGFFAVWMVLISAWASDTFAYFTGVAIGKHKITPVLSPKKTVEGCIGGVVGAGLSGALYGFIIYKCGFVDARMIWIFAVLGLCGSVAGQIGDLAASGIKRNFGIKDYGKIIPGHGGVMDRFDSVTFTGPLVFLLVCLFLC